MGSAVGLRLEELATVRVSFFRSVSVFASGQSAFVRSRATTSTESALETTISQS